MSAQKNSLPTPLRPLTLALLLSVGTGTWAQNLAAPSGAGASPPSAPEDSASAQSPTSPPSNPENGPNGLRPIVVTGTRVPHDPMDVAASVSVIERNQIVDGQPRVDLTEDLNGIAGLQGLNRHNYAQDLQISSRGFGARSPFGTRSIKLYTDGIPATMADGQGQTSTFNLDQASRIEVLQGPMSAIYGNSAGGVIQLFTRDGSGPPTADASVEAGSFNTWKTDYDVLGSQSGVGYLVDSSHFHTDGYRPDSKANRDQQMAKFSLNPTDNGKLTFVFNADQQHDTQDPMGLSQSAFSSDPYGPVAAKQGPNTFYPDLAAAYGTRKDIIHSQGGMTYDQAFGADHLQMTLYTGNRHVTQFQSATASLASNAGVIDYARNFYGENVRWIAVRELGEKSTLTVTTGLDNDEFQDNRKGFTNFTTSVTSGALTCGINATCGMFGNQKRQETDTAQSTDPYVQAEWAIDNWLLTGGLRYSRVSFNVNNSMSNGLTSAAATGAASGNLVFTHTTPMLSALYKINARTNYYISASQGFETPTMDEMFYSRSGPASVADRFNFNLKASTIQYYETGLKSMVNDNTNATFALYHILASNEAVVDVNVNGAAAYKNADTQRDGVEWNLDSQFTPTLKGMMSITLMHAFYPNASTNTIGVGISSFNHIIPAGSQIPGVAEKTAYAELAWQPLSGAETAAEFTARDHMYVEDTNTQMAAPGYATFNWRFMLHQENDGWKFKEFARIDNLFNRVYAGSVIIGDAFGRNYETAPGRNTMLGASASYAF